MKISTRLILGFGILTLLIALIGGVSLIKAGNVGGAFDLVIKDRYAKVDGLHSIKDGMSRIASLLRNALLMDSPAEIKAQLDEVQSVRAGMAEHWDMLHATITTDKGKELLTSAEEARSQYVVVHDKFVSLINSGKLAEAKGLLQGDLRPRQLAYFAGVDAMISFQKSLMTADAQSAASDISSMKVVILTLGTVAIIAAVLMALWIIRSITLPLGRAVALARAVADGDLSLHFTAPEGRCETTQLLNALKAMQTNLVDVVAHVRSNAEALASAIGEISLGNADLAGRTEGQAAALEETAASMEQLTGTVRNNADNARQASGLTTNASEIAKRGGDVVDRVVDTMRGISESSGKVAEIVGVIEGIAFQTNILALNASVEAARAGENGRGFAVVANEVRVLAQRSASAVKEIQELIGDSVSRVQDGTKLVDEAGSTMTEIVGAVMRVTDMMGEIATASREQSTGIEQVNTAVSQMEQMTQQNAALVEQASAAAQSLVAQAEDLRKAVSVFKLDGQANYVAKPVASVTPTAPARGRGVAAQQPRAEKASSSASDWEAF